MNNLPSKQGHRLNQLYLEIVKDAQSLLTRVIEAGGILTELKASLPHGEFAPWVNDNLVFSMRTAQRYMKIYLHREELKNDSVSLLNDAHKMLTTPAPDRLTSKEKEQLLYLEGMLDAGLHRVKDAGLSIDDILEYVQARGNA